MGLHTSGHLSTNPRAVPVNGGGEAAAYYVKPSISNLLGRFDVILPVGRLEGLRKQENCWKIGNKAI